MLPEREILGWNHESGLALYLERPEDSAQLLAKWSRRLRERKGSLHRVDEGYAAGHADGQLGVIEELVEDISWMQGTKPCGICPRVDPKGSHRACRHRAWSQEQIARYVLMRAGYRVAKQASSPAPVG